MDRTVIELDEETCLYYYGARYLDPKYSMWISTDPALGEYIPKAPIDEEAKKYNQNLPGMGGVFNHINSNLYHYAGNNPVRYIDPTGQWIDNEDGTYTAEDGDIPWSLYGQDWQEKSRFNRDSRTLQVGETVGKKTSTVSGNLTNTVLTIGNNNTQNINNIPGVDQSDKLKANLNKAGDILGKISIGLNLVSAVCTLTGNVALAGCLDIAAATCDIAATGLYLASGNNAQAAVALTATLMDFVPGPYKFNKGANRYISKATGKFVSKTLGKQAAILPKTVGIGLNFLNAK